MCVIFQSRLEAICKRELFTFQDILVMDSSSRTTKANAFFIGMGSTKRIVLFDTIIESLDEDQLAAVLLHELCHERRNHVGYQLVIVILQMAVYIYLLLVFVHNDTLAKAFRMDHTSTYAGLFFFAVLFQPVSFVVGLISLIISRRNEFEADHYAISSGMENAEPLMEG
jgi:STE24 endopeptidase